MADGILFDSCGEERSKEAYEQRWQHKKYLCRVIGILFEE